MSELHSTFPQYEICKLKVYLDNGVDANEIIEQMKIRYEDQENSQIDGLKLVFPKEWVHLRKSNTEPIMRVYAESQTMEKAQNLAERFVQEIKSIGKP